MIIRLNIRKIKIFCLMVIGFLVCASLFVNYERYFHGRDRLFGLVRLFDLDSEQNIPTWYQATMLFLASVLAWMVSRVERAPDGRFGMQWKGIAFIFAGMSVDEYTSIHELVGEQFIQTKLHLEGSFHSAWLFLGIPFVVAFALFYWKFLFSMPPVDRKRFIFAGLAYLTGVMFLEIIGGFLGAKKGEESMAFSMLSSLEELFEMMGQLALVVALLRWIQRRAPNGPSLEVVHE